MFENWKEPAKTPVPTALRSCVRSVLVDIAGGGQSRPAVEAAAQRGARVYHGTVMGEDRYKLMGQATVAVVPSLRGWLADNSSDPAACIARATHISYESTRQELCAVVEEFAA